MLGEHLDEMIQRGVRFVIIASIVIAVVVVMVVMEKIHLMNRGVIVVVMSLTEKMVSDVTCLEDE